MSAGSVGSGSHPENENEGENGGEGDGDGDGGGDLFCFQVTECVVRPDVDLKRLMATAIRLAEVLIDMLIRRCDHSAVAAL